MDNAESDVLRKSKDPFCSCVNRNRAACAEIAQDVIIQSKKNMHTTPHSVPTLVALVALTALAAKTPPRMPPERPPLFNIGQHDGY